MKQSESITELATAMNLFQAELDVAKKSATNPFLKSSYADLESVIEAVREPLAIHGLSFVQMLGTTRHENAVAIETQIMHKSGEWIRSDFTMPAPPEAARGVNIMQTYGSVVTYAKRYALSAALGVATGEDNDGDTGASKVQKKAAPKAPAKKQAPKVEAKLGENGQAMKRFHALGNEVYADDWTSKRRELCDHFGVNSSKDLTMAQAKMLMDNFEKAQKEQDA